MTVMGMRHAPVIEVHAPRFPLTSTSVTTCLGLLRLGSRYAMVIGRLRAPVV